ncbi:MAG TPA: hypothetical protein VK641_09435 [Terriglobales bacterium]|jgi:hypothetical protein|nr:hypothetical protein [Terriglobales bacterium]
MKKEGGGGWNGMRVNAERTMSPRPTATLTADRQKLRETIAEVLEPNGTGLGFWAI